jgi:hypothetical protein
MPGDVKRGPILNNDALERNHKRKTNLLKELITELRVGNREILEELALESMMPALGRGLMAAVTPVSVLSSIGVSSEYFIAASSEASPISCCK